MGKMLKSINKEIREFNKYVDSYFKSFKNKSYLIKAMIYGTLNGGKRIRPLLVMYLSKYLKIKKINYMRVALASELVHCYSLIHDDMPVMDNDTYRRGILTTHKKFDEATALLAGNSLLTLAFEIIADKRTHSDSFVRSEIIKALASISGKEGLAAGQSLDLLYEKKKVLQKDILKMHYLKTARLFEFCTSAPFIMLGSSNKEINQAKLYGKNFGLIFQATDDLLDFIGDKKKLGKATNKDLMKNKGSILLFKNETEVKEYCIKLAKQATKRSTIFGREDFVLKKLIFSIIDRTT